MANRYWVGGAGTWNATAITNWAATSGGAGGQTAPTADDSVFIDAASGLTTGLTITTSNSVGALVINNLTITPNAAVGSAILALGGSLTVNGTFSTSGTAGNKRFRIQSDTFGLVQSFIVNSFSNISDIDFRDIYFCGSPKPLSGTRIGNLRNNTGITFSTPKTVYWNLTGAQNWSATAWALTSGGVVNTENFPLAQDTAIINNTGAATTVTIDAAIPYIGTIDFSSRTSAVALVCALTPTIYGSWILGSGVTLSGAGTLTFSGDSQTIISASKTFTQNITIDSVVGGAVTLGDNLTTGGAVFITVTRGVFNTAGFNVTTNSILSNNSNIRTIDLTGTSTSSTLTLTGSTGVNFTTSTNLTFIPGTSTSNLTTTGSSTPIFGSVTWYNVNFTANRTTTAIVGAATFNNLSFAQTSGICTVTLTADITITGRLTITSTNATTRTFISSITTGIPRTITAAAVSLSDCDFLDIIGAGSANWSGTRLGNCGGNTGISFPIAKTVYWNLAGAQNWTAVAWCTNNTNNNGVTLEAPNINNFPLPQDTASFNEVGTITGIITISNDWNLGTLDTSARSVTAATLSCGSQSPRIYGNFTLGTAVTFSSSALYFQGRGTQTIITNGRTFTSQLWINNGTGTTQLGDALNMNATTLSGFNHLSGTFNAVTFNITHTGQFNSSSSLARTLYMGTGTWTTSYSANCWQLGGSNLTFYKGTANIVLSDTTNSSSRTFSGASGYSYNKITIGGAAATGQTVTMYSGSETPTIAELASTKTVAWTLALGTTGIITLGAWTITGTVGNVVTVTGTSTLFIAGPRVQGVNYLALGTTLLSTTSPGEFYAGANSTGGLGTITLTAAPTARVLYWRGNGGTWDTSTTTNWALTSGAVSGGQAPPTSADTVNINAGSGTGTITFSGAQLRCGILNITGGTFTLSGTAPLAIHGSITLPSSGLTMSTSGGFLLSGTGAKTITSSGTSFGTTYVQVNGIGSTWTLASNMTITQDFLMTNGSFNTAGFTFTVFRIFAISSTYNTTSLSFGSSTINLNGSTPVLDFSINATGFAPNQTFDAGTSTINITGAGVGNIYLSGKTFYNVNFTYTGGGETSATIYGQNTFRNLSIAASLSTSTSGSLIFGANQIITNTLTASGTAANRRISLRSDTIGTPRTLTVGSFSPVDCDFRDITISGISVTGTRLGNCGGNTGITFDAGKTVYWNLAGAQNWSATAWCTNTANDNGVTLDAPSVNSFPLAQDTAKFNTVGTVSGTITMDRSWNIGTIDMSARGAIATMTLATSTAIPAIYGNWINGDGLTLSGTGIITFAGRGTQIITSAGKTFTQPITINSGSGTVQLGDALTISATNFILTSGTFNSANYNVQAVSFNSSGTTARTLSMGSSTWTISSSTTPWTCTTSTNLTVNKGTSNIILSDATSGGGRIFAGGGLSYNKLTIGGTSVAGTTQTVTFTGNNSFGEITTTKTAPLTINLTTTIQTIGIWSANGGPAYRVSINGTSGINPATLIVQDPNLVKFSNCNLNSIKMQNKAYFTRANSISYVQGFNLLKNTSSLSSIGQLTTNYNGQISEISINPSYSVFFNGTTNYLNITGTMPTIGTSDFTIEGWFYFTSLAATTQLFDGSPNGGGTAPLSPIVNTNGTVLSFYSNGAYRITGTTTLVTGTWYHVACCRVSGTTRIFLNGRQQGISYSDSTSYASTANSFFIGRNASAANSYMSGYISNFRVISGITGLYSADFTVPTASLTAITGTSLLTAKYTTIIDGTSTYTVSSNSSLPTAYFYPEFYSVNSTNLISENIDGTITADVFDDYTISPISGGLARKVYSDGTYQTAGAIDEFSNIDTFSANFTGTNYLTVSTDPSLTTSATGDWTIEAWLYPTLSSASIMRLWKFSGGVENSDLITSTGVLSYTNGAGGVVTTSTATGLVPVNVWTHVAFVKRSGTLTIYTGGVARATQSPATGTNSFTVSLQIGTGDAGLNFTGYMSNFRYVKGVAVYTGTFTPPTYNLQAIQSAGTNISAITGTATSLLTCQGSRIADFSTRKLPITNTLSVAMLNSIPGPF